MKRRGLKFFIEVTAKLHTYSHERDTSFSFGLSSTCHCFQDVPTAYLDL